MTSLPDKPSLRKAQRDLRRAFVATLSDAERHALWQRLAAVALPHLRKARIVASYWASGSEIDPIHLENALRAQDVTLALPRITAPDVPLSFHLCGADDPLVANQHAILEPAADAPLVVPDVVLTPLIAVDQHGQRLGQGGGYYDRTLAALRSSRPVMAVGLAYDCQIVYALPHDPHDRALDALATPTSWQQFTKS